MNHRPFEDWLLEDEPLSTEQQRELQAHLRGCTSCTAIAESNLALHTTGQASPSAGFAARFGQRLVVRRKTARLRQFIGILILALGGLALLAVLTGPVLQELIQSPAAWISSLVDNFVILLTSLQTLGETSRVLFRVLPGFIPPLDWFIVSALAVGLTCLWTLSIWRFTRIPQGA